jgi:outer membrane protein assembly factor BamB
MRNHFSSCLLIDGFIYGIDGNAGNGALRCLRLETGEEQWAENLGFGTVIAADGKLIVLNERGGIFIAEARPDGYHELARAEAAVPVDNGAKCWTVPVLCRGLLYCRNSAGTLVCVDLRG